MNEEAVKASARLAAYRKISRKAEEQLCPPLFQLQGLDQLFVGKSFDELIKFPFIGRCDGTKIDTHHRT